MAIVGFDGSTYLKSIEIYDPETSSWKLGGSINYRRLGGGVGVIKLQSDSQIFQSSNNSNNVQT